MTWLYLRECEESFKALEKRPTYALPEFKEGFEYGWRAACRFVQDAPKLTAPGRMAEWLLNRERDIAHGIEDFGDLYDLFRDLFGREPNKL